MISAPKISKRIPKLSLAIKFVGALFIALTPLLVAVPVKAETTYGNLLCQTYPAIYCPPRTKEVADVGFNGACVPNDNNFCRFFTGSGQTESYANGIKIGSSFTYCSAPVLPEKGTCGSNINNSVFTIADFTVSVSAKQSDYYTADGIGLEALLGSNESVVLTGDTDLLRGPTLRCNYVGGDASRPRLIVPNASTIFSRFNIYDSEGFVPQQIDQLSENYKIMQKYIAAGFRLRDEAKTTNFCNNDTDILIGKAEDSSTQSCVKVSTIAGSNRGCIIPGGNICVKEQGSDQQFFPFQLRSSVAGRELTENLAPRFQTYPEKSPTWKTSCQLSSVDVLRSTSNKGCSDLLTFDTNTSTSVPRDKERYKECLVCLYGDNPKTVSTYEVASDVGGAPRPVNLEEYVRKVLGLEPTQVNDNGTPLASLAGRQLIDGNNVYPDLEPLAKPIQGRFFGDFGCTNTNGVSQVANTVLRFALGLMSGICVIRIIQGSLQMQAGDPEAISEGRSIIIAALVGLLTLIFSGVILNFIGFNLLGLDSNSGFFSVGTAPTTPVN